MKHKIKYFFVILPKNLKKIMNFLSRASMCALNHFKKTRAVARYMQYTADGSRNYSVMFACVPVIWTS